MRELFHKWDSLLSNLRCEIDLKSFPELLAGLHNAIKRSCLREYLLLLTSVSQTSLRSVFPLGTESRLRAGWKEEEEEGRKKKKERLNDISFKCINTFFFFPSSLCKSKYGTKCQKNKRKSRETVNKTRSGAAGKTGRRYFFPAAAARRRER